ncbi:H-2 class I histocompatibility antigen, Q10 alpha chain-like isoform X2 [Ctenopharyngodon idella]|uniref:H-2 class I histocompatibility antigen, Q10 alpha chain-like isoform X2 n=1 Tax=Ctenopharyngodon idella TaxID=7959 RepID=UPI002231381B|nr:H-2 class I histocompatibility antigen, Q10 alpha chain-like isoform X2 [Ctenopharyngodon idella]
MGTGFDRIALFCVFLLNGTLRSARAEKHSLYYIYTGLSKPVNLPGIYEFTAVGLLDDTQIDYYNSEERRMIPTQSWMKEKLPEDYWEKSTQSRESKEQWFNVNVPIMMDRMRHNKSDLHVLQWRHGCEVEQQGDEVKFLKGIDEFSYDGEDFLSFDDKESQWVAPVDAALPAKRKWDNVPILNQYTKGYLEKECVDWLNKFREYGDEKLRKTSPPDVHMFAKRYIKYKTRLKLTCMATGFYHKDLKMTIRKYNTSLPEHETKSTGIRPNHDGSFQMRNNLEIKEGDERAVYYCLVSHKSLKEPIINIWDGKCWDCLPETPTGAVIGAGIGAVIGAGIGAGIGAVIGAGIEAVIEAVIGAGLGAGIGAGIGVVLVLAFFGLVVFKRINGPESRKRISNINVSSSREDLNSLVIIFRQIPAEKMVSVPEQLLQILDDLDSYNLKRFKWYLKQRGLVSASLLENADNIDIVDQMVNSFEQNGALEHTVDILKMMNQNQLAEKLIKNYKV